ncbi:MAG: non-homologous end-joining DNA ligase [Desulfitobacteriia bacterium]|jgi:bifunctional non-homologous end joining protein LigD
MVLEIEGKEIKISNPQKLLWPKQNISKADYLQCLIDLAPYILPHCKNHLLTTIRYPNGISGKSFFQKNKPRYSPPWVPSKNWRDNEYILLNDLAVLLWLGNQAALEFHISFNLAGQEDNPQNLVFDLDPSEGQTFEAVIEAALLIKKDLDQLGLKAYAKTSGASGLQIYIPVGGRYDYKTARQINKFFADYFSQKYPQKITITRQVDKRENKLYFDYLQMAPGKTIIGPYSPRATPLATVATPIEWGELEKGIKPQDFTLRNIKERLQEKEDLFAPLNQKQDLGFILKHLNLANR